MDTFCAIDFETADDGRDSGDSRLTLVGPADRPGFARYRCVCGTEKDIRKDSVKRGLTRSCGCIPGGRKPKHGGSRRANPDPLYGVWSSILSRCYLKTNRAYRNYGGRGVTVCDRWRESFAAFREDVGPRPSPAHSIDRIDNDKGYEPGNVRWATRKEQSRNRRSNHPITHDGQTLLLVEWAEKTGISVHLIRARIYRLGWTVERALTTPVRPHA